MREIIVQGLWRSSPFCALSFFALMSAATYNTHTAQKAGALRLNSQKIYTFLSQQKNDLLKTLRFLEHDYPLYIAYEKKGSFRKKAR